MDKRGIVPAKSPLFLAPRGRGRGRGQLLKKERGITGMRNRCTFEEFRGIFPAGIAISGKGTGTMYCFEDFQRNFL